MELEKKLQEATLAGNATAVNNIIRQDPLILDRIAPTFYNETPLHIAALRGHFELTTFLLTQRPEFVTEVEALGNTPLHLASAKGHVQIVRELIRADSGRDACLMKNKVGKIPLHLAVMKGKIEVVKELIRACQDSITVKVERGESVIHLCVRTNCVEVLQLLVGYDGDGVLLNLRDEDGNSVLHLAAMLKQLETIRLLLSVGVQPNLLNNNGFTALDLVYNSPRDIQNLEVLSFLIESGVPRAKDLTNTLPATQQPSSSLSSSINPTKHTILYSTPQPPKPKRWKRLFRFDPNTVENMRAPLLIASTMLVAATYIPLAYIPPQGSDLSGYYSLNSVSMLASLCVMLLLLSGIRLKSGFSVWLVTQLMYTAIGFLVLNYLGNILSNENRYYDIISVVFIILIWFVLLAVLSLINIVKLIVWIQQKVRKCRKRRGSQRSGQDGLAAAA